MWGHIVGHRRSMLFVPMGMGKTSSVLMAISILLMSGSARKVLVLAPLRVAQSTWPDEAKKWAEFSHLRVSAIIGTPTERLAALRVEADIYTINYDNLVWLIETVGDKWFWDMVVSDEITRLKSFRTKQGGKRAQALGKVAHERVKRWVGLTGTPVPNGVKDLWGQMWFIDQGARLGSTYTAFMNRWFGFRNAKDAANNSGKAYVERVPFPHAQKEIEVLVKDVCLTLDVKDWFDVKEPVVNTLYVDLPPKQRKHYREMERELYTVLENNEIEAFGAAAKTIKCLQMASGAAYINGSNDEWVEMHDEKLQALESIIEEAAGASVLVAYHFKSDLARIQRRFPQARVLDKKPQTILDWNEGRIGLLLAHPASAGHGLNLQDGGNILVFFSHWWSLEERQQIVERIGPVRQLQAGHDRPVFIHQIVARNTVDEDVIARILTKQDVQDVLLQALKRRLKS
jgi:SNF2 family DNA or RNA helicase